MHCAQNMRVEEDLLTHVAECRSLEQLSVRAQCGFDEGAGPLTPCAATLLLHHASALKSCTRLVSLELDVSGAEDWATACTAAVGAAALTAALTAAALTAHCPEDGGAHGSGLATAAVAATTMLCLMDCRVVSPLACHQVCHPEVAVS